MLLATFNFMPDKKQLVFRKTLPLMMHEIASLGTYNFKIFRGSIPRILMGWLAPSGESGLPLIYAACFAALDACENFC